MSSKKAGQHSIRFEQPPHIWSGFTLVGPKEGAGPLGSHFDTVLEDTYYGEKCWERAESKMLKEVVQHAIAKAQLKEESIDFCVTSDLLNQCTASSYAVRDLTLPHLGVYSACASFAQGLIIAGMAIDGGFATHAVVAGSSHHDAAERQYRFPTELGVQRPPYAQWTVTGAGALVLGPPNGGPRLTGATLGCVQDYGVRDAFDMGAAMAPAAAATLERHFYDFGRKPEDYDLIITGDLARVGAAILMELMKQRGFFLGDRYTDCGILIYSQDQDVHSGASGLGSSATVFPGYVLKKMHRGELRRVLLAGTGALHSPTSIFQGESIPAICHAVSIEM